MDLTRAVLLTATILSVSPFDAQAQQAIYIVRHAEQVQGADDPPLTADGRQRARALADILRESGITAVYSSQAQRTRQTAQPMVDVLGTQARQVPREKTAELIARIRAEEPTGRVLVVGHSETVPQILRGLGHPEQITIDKSDYGNIFVVVPNGTSTPLVLRQRFAPAAPGIFGAVVHEPASETPQVSTEELDAILANGSAVVLDTRPYREFALSHIPGAKNVAPKLGMPMHLYTSDVAEVERLTGGDKTKPLILYCNGPSCGKSKRVAEDLLLRWMILLMKPVLIPLSFFNRWIAPQGEKGATVSRAELEVLAEIGRREGTIDEDEWQIVTNVMNLDEVRVAAVMTPRTSIAAVPIDASIAHTKNLMLDEGHLRVPIYEGSLDHIVGILLARDLWKAERSGI